LFGEALKAVHQAPAKRILNAEKLLLSKWTAVAPRHKEKHFLVTQLLRDEAGQVVGCLLEAVLSKNAYLLDWRTLKDSAQWLQGWH